MTLSKHLINDRMERAAFILANIGLGKTIKEHYCEADQTQKACWRTLTDTGVIIVYDKKKKKVVTMYIASMKQAKAFFPENAYILPKNLYSVIKKNQKYI